MAITQPTRPFHTVQLPHGSIWLADLLTAEDAIEELYSQRLLTRAELAQFLLWRLAFRRKVEGLLAEVGARLEAADGD
jgi:hypothetical protein